MNTGNTGVGMSAHMGSGRIATGKGFSLIEMMVVLTIAAVLLGIAVPNFRALVQNQQLAGTTSDLLAAINLTRSEAIQRGARVDLVPAGDGGDWARGWIVFVDQNGNQRPDAGESIIFSHGPAPKGLIINAVFTDSKVQYLAYNGSGRTRTNANSQSPQSGTFTVGSGGRVRKIKINFLGRARVCDPEQEGNSC